MIRVFEAGQEWDLALPENQRVAVKPNLTFPDYKEGVTTTPAVLERVVEMLVARGNQVFVVEGDGGYGSWECERAMEGHGIYELCDRHGATAVNLTKTEWTSIEVRQGRTRIDLPYSKFLLEEIDAFISMPVPKVHCLTGVSLGMKNQWGVVPDPYRLNFHYIFTPAILEVNRRLPNASVIADGTFFLDDNGPMDGTPVRRDLIIQADSIGEFDRYLCAMMSVDPMTIRHLKHAIQEGYVPADLSEVEHDAAQLERLRYEAQLNRTPRNWMALTFFHSKGLTRLLYTSAFGKFIHKIYWGIVGRPAPV